MLNFILWTYFILLSAIKECAIYVSLLQQRNVFFLILLSSLVLLVTCVIMQKNGAGMQTASTCFWDNSTDGKDKNTCVFLM